MNKSGSGGGKAGGRDGERLVGGREPYTRGGKAMRCRLWSLTFLSLEQTREQLEERGTKSVRQLK